MRPLLGNLVLLGKEIRAVGKSSPGLRGQQHPRNSFSLSATLDAAARQSTTGSGHLPALLMNQRRWSLGIAFWVLVVGC